MDEKEKELRYNEAIKQLADSIDKSFIEISGEYEADFLQRHNATMYLTKRLLKME
jgi:hypothetical protein